MVRENRPAVEIYNGTTWGIYHVLTHLAVFHYYSVHYLSFRMQKKIVILFVQKLDNGTRK